MTNEQFERKSRFIQVVKHLDIDREEIAKALGYKKRYLDNLLSLASENKVSDLFALKFIKWCNRVNENWLMKGVEPMLREEVIVDYNQKDTIAEAVGESSMAYDTSPSAALNNWFKLVHDRLSDIESRLTELEAKRINK